MALFSKFNYISGFNNSSFVILNQNSNVNIKNVDIDNITPTLNINNGVTNIISAQINNAISSTITINNSSNYIDNLDFNNNTFLFTEKGSTFNYENKLIYSDSWTKKSNTQELLIPSSIEICKSNKSEYIKYNPQVRTQGTGNECYSTHYLTNNIYGYWGNKYGGQFIKDSEIIIDNSKTSGILDLSKVINSIPRNLNGYTVSIKINSNINNAQNVTNITIKDFCNGTLNIQFKDLNIGNFIFNIINNNAVINLIGHDFSLVTFNANDNEDLNLSANILNNGFFKGINNMLTLNIKTYKNTINIFIDPNSFSNKIHIKEPEEGLDNLNNLSNNNLYKGNYYIIENVNTITGSLVNDNDGEVDNIYDKNFTINEVHPYKDVRDFSDIGTIIGWNKDLPIPRGYYKCDGSIIAIDIHNPQDEFYNGQLAYYLNKNLTGSTITLPDIPSAAPTIQENDPNYNISTQKVRDTKAGLIYIIKYNNNFENKKELL